MYTRLREFDFTNVEKSENYRIYEDESGSSKVYLIKMADAKTINDLIDKYKKIERIPDDYVLECLEMINTKTIRKNREVWKLVSQLSTPVQINKLIPLAVGQLNN